MGILDMIINKTAPKFGKSPQEIKKAIDEGKRIIDGMPNTVDGAKKIMQDNNIPTTFLDKAVNIVSPFSAVFGVKKDSIMRDVETLKSRSNTGGRSIERSQDKPRKNNNFKSKYPKI